MIFINPRPVFESIDFEVEPLLDVIGLNEQLTESYVSLGKPKEMEQVLEFSFKKIWEAVKRFFRNLIDKIKGFFSRKKKEHQQKSEEIKKTLADADKKVEELKHQKPEENKSDLKVGDEKPGSKQVVYTPRNNSLVDKDKNATYQRTTDGKIVKTYNDMPKFDKEPPKYEFVKKRIEKKTVDLTDIYDIKEEVYEYNFYVLRLDSTADLLYPVKYYDKMVRTQYDEAFEKRKDDESIGERDRGTYGKNTFGREEKIYHDSKYQYYLNEARRLFEVLINYVGTTSWLKDRDLDPTSNKTPNYTNITADYIKSKVRSDSKVKKGVADIKANLSKYEKITDSWDKSYQAVINELNRIQSAANGELSLAEKISKEKDTIAYDILVEGIKKKVTLVNKCISALVLVVNAGEALINEMVSSYSSIVNTVTSTLQHKFDEEYKNETEKEKQRREEYDKKYEREREEYFEEKKKHEEKLTKWAEEKGISKLKQ